MNTKSRDSNYELRIGLHKKIMRQPLTPYALSLTPYIMFTQIIDIKYFTRIRNTNCIQLVQNVHPNEHLECSLLIFYQKY